MKNLGNTYNVTLSKPLDMETLSALADSLSKETYPSQVFSSEGFKSFMQRIAAQLEEQSNSSEPSNSPPPTDSTTPDAPPPSDPVPSDPVPSDPVPSDPTPPVSSPDATGLPGFTLQNTSGASEGSGYVSFGQMFAKGAVMPGQTLTAHIDGQDVAVQMDVKTTNDDGSVGHAILTLKAPAMAAGGSVSGSLATGGSASSAPAIQAPTIQAQDILSHGYDFQVQVALHDGSNTVKTIDAAQLLQQAIDSGHVESWMQGAQASEYRVSANVAPNLDVKFDIRMDAAGQTHTDVIFARDDAYSTNTATLTYDVKFTQGGQTVFSDADIQQYAYSTWHQAVASPGAVDPHVVYDTAYLIATGAIPAYDLSTSVSAATIADQLQRLAQADTGPLGSALLNQYMPTTGNRPDIGPETAWTAEYLTSQSADAAKIMYANADAAGGVPWHLVGTDDEVLRISDRSNSWPVTFNPAPSGWTMDVAHEPSLTFVPYLLSGSHYYLDELQAQANYVVASQNPDYRDGAAGILSDHNEVRAIAWGLRELANAAYITPDADALKGYFTTLLSNNLDHFMTEYVNGATGDAQGQLEGWIQGVYGNANMMAPWQQDYVATTLALIAGRGDDQAATVLGWMDNFIAGRFTNDANGFDPLHGATYNLQTLDPATGQPFTTWAEAYDATFGSAPADGLDQSAYPDWAGGYAAKAKAALASIISTTQSPDAIEAYGWLQSQTTAMLESYQTDPTWNIAPKLANGQYLTNDEIHVQTATSAATLTAGAGEQMLIGNIGADTIVGGSGIGLLFGMDGNDTIKAGSGNSYLFGGDGNDRLVDGAGSNYFKGGTGRDVFAFAADAHATITDFKSADDRIELSGVNASDVHVSNSGGSTYIDLGNNGRITVAGATLSQSALNISHLS
jgi:Ca2+-binding RTX toxin-like protein